MNINAGIVDQCLTGIIHEHGDALLSLDGKNPVRQRTLAFALLCVCTALELEITEALENLYSKKDIPLQQLAATFRRGDLIAYLA